MRTNHLLIVLCPIIGLTSCTNTPLSYEDQAISVLRDQILLEADKKLQLAPFTITGDSCERSAGSIHDFYSEGDYWWPNPEDPDGPYTRRDGLTNPENFVAHRESLMRFSEMVGTLTSAYIITKEQPYAHAALRHCKAWLIDSKTKMNPNFLYSQAIKGRFTGRGIGIIDAIHLMDIAQSLKVLEQHAQIEVDELGSYKKWFGELVSWLTTHQYGIDERDWYNNHATWWNAQVALYADFIQNEEVLQYCINNYKNRLLPEQMAKDGSFPEELKRTKPYSYSLFNLDAMTMTCLILSNSGNNLWQYENNGRSISKGLAYMAPFVLDKSSWPLPPDIQYWDNWPVAHPSFIFGALAYDNPEYFQIWKENEHFLKEYEIRRTVANKSPIIWLSRFESLRQ